MTRIASVAFGLAVLAAVTAFAAVSMLAQPGERPATSPPGLVKDRPAVAEPGALPAAQGAPILELAVAGEPPLKVDLHQLDAMPQVRLTIKEPFVNQNITFTGVMVADLLRYAGATGDRAKLTAVAHDSFKVDLAVKDLLATSGVIATRADARTIAIAKGGPTRLVFPASSHPMVRNTDSWIWSIKRMTVR